MAVGSADHLAGPWAGFKLEAEPRLDLVAVLGAPRHAVARASASGHRTVRKAQRRGRTRLGQGTRPPGELLEIARHVPEAVGEAWVKQGVGRPGHLEGCFRRAEHSQAAGVGSDLRFRHKSQPNSGVMGRRRQ